VPNVRARALSIPVDFDVPRPVPGLKKPSPMTCWAAATAMLVSYKEGKPVSVEEAVRRAGGRYEQLLQSDAALAKADMADYLSALGLASQPAAEPSVEQVEQMLRRFGAVWLTPDDDATFSLDARIVTGIHGDGTSSGTNVVVLDPSTGTAALVAFGRLSSLFQRQSLSNATMQLMAIHWLPDTLGAAVLQGASLRDVLLVQDGQTITQNGRRRHFENYPVGFGSPVAIAAAAVAAGHRYIDTTTVSPDPLAGHGGTGENLCIIWNAIPSDFATLDVVVHLHGYSSREPDAAMLQAKVAEAGLDLAGRTRPTVGIIARGRKITAAELHADPTANPRRYTFPALTRGNGAGLHQLVIFVLDKFAQEALGLTERQHALDRVIFTAHSGGGAPLNQLLAWRRTNALLNPEEVHVFDGLYGDVTNLVAWARERIAADRGLSAAHAPHEGGGLRIIYRDGKDGTATNSRVVEQALPAANDSLHAAYRAELTRVDHDQIPVAFGPTLLQDVRSELAARASAHSIDTTGLSWEEVQAFAVDDAARAWLNGDAEARRANDASVTTWINATDRSAIELIADAARRRHFLHDVDWSTQHFSGSGPNTRESEALFNEMAQLVPERRVPTMIRFHTVNRDDTEVVPSSGGHRLYPEAKEAFVRMRTAAQAAGIPLTIGSSWRSVESQQRLAADNPNPAAVAQGISAHNYGLTVDLHLTVSGLPIAETNTESMVNMVAMYRSPIYKWLALHAREFGWFPYRREPWHWEYNPIGFKERFEGPRTGSAMALQNVPIDWCQMRQTIANAARTEEARWTRPNGSKLLENEDAAKPILQEYWRAVPGVNAVQAAQESASNDENLPFSAWSAAFICAVMRAAGVQAVHGFDFGPRHMDYIVGALRNRERSDQNRPFWLMDSVEIQAEATPEPGDLICLNRQFRQNGVLVWTTHSYSSLRQQFWEGGHQNVPPEGRSHCALVVGIWQNPAGDRFVETIGGNETHSVRVQHDIQLSASGGIANPAAHHVFGMIKLIGCNR
jgi:hypothetical protein